MENTEDNKKLNTDQAAVGAVSSDSGNAEPESTEGTSKPAENTVLQPIAADELHTDASASKLAEFLLHEDDFSRPHTQIDYEQEKEEEYKKLVDKIHAYLPDQDMDIIHCRDNFNMRPRRKQGHQLPNHNCIFKFFFLGTWCI